VGEATALETVVAHKGFDNYIIEVAGVAAHSSVPEKGNNAIAQASRIVNAIESRLILKMQQMKHRYVGSPTINVAGILGGSRNDSAFLKGDFSKIPGAIVPDYCTIYVDRRRVPGESLDDTVEELRDLLRDLHNEDSRIQAEVRHLKPIGELSTHPPLETSPGHLLVQHCLHWTESIAARPAKPTGVPYWTDGAIFGTLFGVPSIVYGPGHVSTAHSKNDNVPVDELIKAAKVYALLCASVCSSQGS
jgi:acetylornithine deacetylase/succinyl-diaminopimelate desuccinylase-like protein